MSKDLPYFRFTAFEWLNDDISLESYETKGVFADVCAYYWFKNCSITKAKLEQRFSNALTSIEALIKSQIIKVNSDTDFVEISFLNSQFDQLSQLRKVRQDAGRKGGQQSLSKPKAKPKQNRSYKDKDNNKDKEYIKPEFKETFYRWLSYKKDKKQSYKNEDSIKMAYEKLIKLSGSNPETAKLIIEQSLANNWDGLFALKEIAKTDEPEKLKITTGAYSR